MLEHMIEDIEQHLFTLERRPNTRKHFSAILANELLDMIEGFGMLPPPDGVEYLRCARTSSTVVYSSYKDINLQAGQEASGYLLWENEV